MTDPYQPEKISQQQFLEIRHLRYSVHCWGDPSATPLFLLHGWADVGMSFQFLADRLGDAWYLIAPDWRGCGDTAWNQGGYWFPDYLGDLDGLVSHFSPTAPVRLLGHSMGAGVAWLYAGSSPERVSHVVNLDYIGLPDSDPADAPGRYAKWLGQLKTKPQFREYQELDEIAAVIVKIAPHIPPAHARYLAEYWAIRTQTGGYRLKIDPAHKNVNPVLYRWHEALSCWRNISAKPMLIMGEESIVYQRYLKEALKDAIHGCFDALTEVTIPGAGHMLQLESPGEVANIIESFFQD